MTQKKPETKIADDEQALDEQSLEQVSGGARSRGAAGEGAAIASTRRKRVSGGDDDLEDLEVER